MLVFYCIFSSNTSLGEHKRRLSKNMKKPYLTQTFEQLSLCKNSVLKNQVPARTLTMTIGYLHLSRLEELNIAASGPA